jgi:hypothetical protein
MAVPNLGREIDNLHKNVVNLQDKRGIKTTARKDIGSAANSNITHADAEEQNERRINDFNLELGAKGYRYQMLVSNKYRNTCDKQKIITEWEAFCNRLLEAAEHDNRIPKLGLTPEQYVTLSIKYCKSLYIYSYLIRPWLDKTPQQRYKDKKWEWMSHNCSVWQRYGNTQELPSKLCCTAERCVIECPYYDNEGTVTDEQVHSWYKNEYENFTEAEIKVLDTLS